VKSTVSAQAPYFPGRDVVQFRDWNDRMSWFTRECHSKKLVSPFKTLQRRDDGLLRSLSLGPRFPGRGIPDTLDRIHAGCLAARTQPRPSVTNDAGGWPSVGSAMTTNSGTPSLMVMTRSVTVFLYHAPLTRNWSNWLASCPRLGSYLFTIVLRSQSMPLTPSNGRSTLANAALMSFWGRLESWQHHTRTCIC